LAISKKHIWCHIENYEAFLSPAQQNDLMSLTNSTAGARIAIRH